MTLVSGPEEYLFGEEKGLLEVIEGNDPMPRWLPPYLHGLFATTPQEGWSAGGQGPASDVAVTGANPTLVSNVETFANVPLVLTRGADWYRGIGTTETPGPLICTVVGDVVHAGFGEIEPGASLAYRDRPARRRPRYRARRSRPCCRASPTRCSRRPTSTRP